jgi:hypothetical protein
LLQIHMRTHTGKPVVLCVSDAGFFPPKQWGFLVDSQGKSRTSATSAARASHPVVPWRNTDVCTRGSGRTSAKRCVSSSQLTFWRTGLWGGVWFFVGFRPVSFEL